MKLNSPTNETLTAVWINDNYIKYQHFLELKVERYSIKINVTKSIKFVKFVNVHGDDTINREYYLILEEKKKRSWKQANKLCQELFDGHLPWFEGKDRLHELLSLFKSSKEIPAIEAIYIGLRFYAAEVHFLGGLSLHLNHLIASRTANYDWPFGTLPFGLFVNF